MSKKILMMAGPNGAGKTTLTHELIARSPLIYEYLNADEIAKGLAPLHPESVVISASKLMLQRLKELLDLEKNFAFETTASGKNYIRYLKQAKERGFSISLTFIWLSSPEQAIQRVEQRVKQGGHSIPRETIIRRYYSGLRNLLESYLPFCDTALILDNSSKQLPRRIMAHKNEGGSLQILDPVVWKKLKEVAHGR
ncbi:MAG: AAA family ATPase [Chlamydiia bacterium]|nr:AAA family ATPase [Chlamydiia bacterium]